MSLKRRSMTLVIAAALMTTAMPGIAAAQGGTTLAAASTTARPPSGQGSYQDLLRTWSEFLEWRTAQARQLLPQLTSPRHCCVRRLADDHARRQQSSPRSDRLLPESCRLAEHGCQH